MLTILRLLGYICTADQPRLLAGAAEAAAAASTNANGNGTAAVVNDDVVITDATLAPTAEPTVLQSNRFAIVSYYR